MTREEAIKIISQMIKDEEGFLSDNTVEAHKMAIKALEQETTTKNDLPHCQYTDEEIAKSFIEDVEAVKDQLPTKNDLGVDAISRANVRSLICKIDRKYMFGLSGKAFQDLYKGIDDMPSVTPQEPKTGHWIRISPAEIYECSECGQNIMTSDICAYKFCHGCGAKMVEPPEREDT